METARIVDEGEARVSIVALATDEAHDRIGRLDYAGLATAAEHPVGCAWCVTVTPGVVVVRGHGFSGLVGATAALWLEAGLAPPSFAPETLVRQACAWVARLRNQPDPVPGAGAARLALGACRDVVRAFVAPSVERGGLGGAGVAEEHDAHVLGQDRERVGDAALELEHVVFFGRGAAPPPQRRHVKHRRLRRHDARSDHAPHTPGCTRQRGARAGLIGARIAETRRTNRR